tara:strand:- start:5427 stop:5738 length:312 start_codon:yes stop_codon:yes gene_type:complete
MPVIHYPEHTEEGRHARSEEWLYSACGSAAIVAVTPRFNNSPRITSQGNWTDDLDKVTCKKCLKTRRFKLAAALEGREIQVKQDKHPNNLRIKHLAAVLRRRK